MDNFNNQQLPDKVKKFFSGPKIIFAILGLILLGEIIYAVRTLTLPTPPPLVRKASVQRTVGKMSLNVPKTSYRVAEVITVSVMIYTGSKEISGVDLILQYDPKMLEVTPGGLTKGKILNEFPLLNLDAKKGLISISGISTLQNSFRGTGQFAIINFKAKVAGRTLLTIDFRGKGSTTDSNLVEASTSKDILEQVVNLELVVQ